MSAHASYGASAPARSHVRPLARTRAHVSPSAQFPSVSEWLRARKAALRQGFRFRAGGEKLAVIALALGVDDAKASRLLSDAHEVYVTDAMLARLDGTEWAHVAEAVRAVKLGIGAPEARAA